MDKNDLTSNHYSTYFMIGIYDGITHTIYTLDLLVRCLKKNCFLVHRDNGKPCVRQETRCAANKSWHQQCVTLFALTDLAPFPLSTTNLLNSITLDMTITGWLISSKKMERVALAFQLKVICCQILQHWLYSLEATGVSLSHDCTS